MATTEMVVKTEESEVTEVSEVSEEQGQKRPAEAEETLEEEPPAKVAKTNSFKNVFKQLSLMRPGMFFELEKEENVGTETQSYTMVVEVDGVKFYGTGPSKRNAKVVAAEQVLAHLESLGVKPKEKPEVDASKLTVESIVGENSPLLNQTPPLTEEEKALQMSGKNPVMMLHELRPNFTSEIESDERKGNFRKVVISVTVEGQKFEGSGRSNKNARARAAAAALETLFGLEFTDFGENEIPVFLGEDIVWRKFAKKAEKAPAQAKPFKNAVMQLNDMYKGLEFNVIERSGPDHCPFFKVAVDVEGQNYEGSGSTKKAAKLDAAEKALYGLGLSGVLAMRNTQKKQQKAGQQQDQQQKNWNTKKQKGDQWSQYYGGEEDAGQGAGNSNWNNSWMGQDNQQSQNGQMGGGRGRGRGAGRGQPRGQGQGQGRGQGRGAGRGGQMGRGGQSPRGGAGGQGRGQNTRGTGQARGRGNNQTRGFGNTSSWGYGDQNQSDTGSMLNRGRAGTGLLSPPASRARGGRGGQGTRGGAQTARGGWGTAGNTDYDYKDPYTVDTNKSWSNQSYGGYDNSFRSSYDDPYDTPSYDRNFTSSYKDNFDSYSSPSFSSSYSNPYQRASSAWDDYYGY